MRTSPVITNILLAATLLGAVANVAVFARYVQVLKVAQQLQADVQRLQAQAGHINRNFSLARGLAAEAIQYAQKNPDFERMLRTHLPILQRMDLASVRPAAAAAPTP
jgi:hypothetical protein